MLVNHAGDLSGEADIEEQKQRSALRGAIFKYLIIECLKKAGRLLEYRSSVFSSDRIRPLWLLVSSPFQTR